MAGKSARPKPIVKRSSSEKAPARKAAKSNTKAGSNAGAKGKVSKAAPARKAPAAKKAAASKVKPKAKAPARAKTAPPAKKTKKVVPAKAAKAAPARSKTAAAKKSVAPPARRPAPTPPPPRQPTADEAAALRAFERAHKEFARGRFGEARAQFRALIEKYASVSEVTARARTYLNIAESRLRTEVSLPRDADSLYDRGVIELNRGDYVAAQEMFERALAREKREPEAAHIFYGLAATRSRLGSVETALHALQKALELQPKLRLRAQHDQDLVLLRNDPEFERLVFASRF
ncbi:MAG TPA: tetratricopeptide repeat protein [Pyrinomonadaceae bacterium]|nr:tetratricopeptide repeat protein [Pyrinomonadaceae bacterium]